MIDSALVHYESVGRGQPSLFLHGWFGSWRYWMSTMQAISDKNRSYALDLWGFGDSDKSKARYSVPDYVALVDKFIKSMGICQVSLIGHALGAVVMLEYAARYPEQVNKMMVVSLPMNLNCINRKLLNFTDNSVMAKMMWRRRQI
ncbi:MAG: alpha/beta hydrolase, partial [candidate division Zixibacteria bacterium]|nr:alpha/beta hydrolase [candidate division Zixibacteria bacterium]